MIEHGPKPKREVGELEERLVEGDKGVVGFEWKGWTIAVRIWPPYVQLSKRF